MKFTVCTHCTPSCVRARVCLCMNESPVEGYSLTPRDRFWVTPSHGSPRPDGLTVSLIILHRSQRLGQILCCPGAETKGLQTCNVIYRHLLGFDSFDPQFLRTERKCKGFIEAHTCLWISAFVESIADAELWYHSQWMSFCESQGQKLFSGLWKTSPWRTQVCLMRNLISLCVRTQLKRVALSNHPPLLPICVPALMSTAEAIHLGSLIAAHGYIFPISDHVLTLKDDGTLYRFQVPKAPPWGCLCHVLGGL